MRSLRNGAAIAAFAMMWSGSAFGFSLFGLDFSSDKAKADTKPAVLQESPAEAAMNPARTLADNMEAELVKAKQQRQNGDYTSAARALAQLMLVNADDPRILSEYGKVMVAQGRSEDAIAFLKRAVEFSPNDWTLYSAVGAAYDQKNDFANAKIAYDRGMILAPTQPALLNNFAMSRMLAGDLSLALSLISRAQNYGGADPKIAHNAALMNSLRGANSPLGQMQPPQNAMALQQESKVEAEPAKPAPQHASAARPKTVPSLSGGVMMQAVPKADRPQNSSVKSVVAQAAPVNAVPVHATPVQRAGVKREMAKSAPVVAAEPAAVAAVVKTASQPAPATLRLTDQERTPETFALQNPPPMRGLNLSSLSTGALASANPYGAPALRSAAD